MDDIDTKLKKAKSRIKDLKNKTNRIKNYSKIINEGKFDLKTYEKYIEENNNLFNEFEAFDTFMLDIFNKNNGDPTYKKQIDDLYDKFSEVYGSLAELFRNVDKLAQLFWIKKTDDLYDNYNALKKVLENNEAKFLTLVSLLIALMSIIFANVSQIGASTKAIIVTNVSINLAVCVIFFIVNNIINSLPSKNSTNNTNVSNKNQSIKDNKLKQNISFKNLNKNEKLNIFLIIMIIIFIITLVVCTII